MKKLIYLLLIALLLLNSYLAFKLKTNNKTYTSAVNVINKKLDKNKNEILTFEHNFAYEKACESIEFPKDVNLIDVNGNRIIAKDIFNTKNIVLRYSEFNCKDCIEAEINALLKSKEKLKKDIIILAHYQVSRDLYVYYKEFQKKGLNHIKMYLLPENTLIIPVEKLNVPFYFSIDSTLTKSNFFIPQKDKPKLSLTYLENAIKNQ